MSVHLHTVLVDWLILFAVFPGHSAFLVDCMRNEVIMLSRDIEVPHPLRLREKKRGKGGGRLAEQFFSFSVLHYLNCDHDWASVPKNTRLGSILTVSYINLVDRTIWSKNFWLIEQNLVGSTSLIPAWGILGRLTIGSSYLLVWAVKICKFL